MSLATQILARAQRIVVLMLGLTALSSVASAYYHWVYFANRTGPFNPVRARFDLSALPDSHTVSYFVSDQGPGPLMPGDSFQAIVSQIRLAAGVWNGVASSDLRLAFGGISSGTTQQLSPGIDVVFDDEMPPGLLAQSKPMTVADVSFVANGATFVPIVRSKLQLRKDLTNPYQQASYSDSFFLTIVHEFGHTLGLQHSLTSSVMSTSITRATTKAKPLSADDIAGISLLYPAAGFLAGTGSVSGKVAISGTGVNLASVVALSTSGVAVSSMTNPDGTYRIDAIPPGSYYVYAHPLPPPVQGEAYPDNIVPPQDPGNSPFPANTGFDTQFYPGTRDWTQATQINVTAGSTAAAINFSAQQRTGPAVYDMVTYGYLKGASGALAPVQAPPLQSGTRSWIVFFAFGTVVNTNQLAPGLNVTVIGGTAQVEAGTLQYWSGGYLLAVLDTNPVSADTPTALAITVSNDLYVLPAAFTVVPAPPPAISGVTQGSDGQGNPTATISGSNLGASSRVLFDGARASLVNVNPDGSLLVSAPPAVGGYRAAVEVLASDGQTSSQALGSTQPPVFAYNALSSPRISVNPASSSVTAGTDAMVEVTGYDTSFLDGRTAIGFGSSDIFVRQAWVVGAGHLLVNISASPTAPATITSVSVTTGLQLTTLTTAFQIQAANPGQVNLRTPIVNQATQLAGVPTGGTALINTAGLPQNLTGWALIIGGQQSSFSAGAAGQIRASVPSGLTTGPTTVQLIAPNGATIPTVLMQVDPPPPAITAAVDASGVAIGASHAVKSGDTVTLTVYGLADSLNMLPPAANVRINAGGFNPAAVSVAPLSGQVGACLIQFVVPALPSAAQTPVTVGVDTRVSGAYPIAVQN